MNVKSSILHTWIHWKNSVSRLILSWPAAHTAPGLEARYMLWPWSHTLQMCTGDAGTWGTAPVMPLGCPAAEQLSDKPVCQPSSAPAPRLHKFILIKQYVYIYTTQTFYEETFSRCLYHTLAHSWGYKLLFLYCLLSGLHLSISAYKRRKERKQARKKKGRFGAEIVAILRTQKEDRENYLSTHFNSQTLDLALHSRSVFGLLRALL